MKNKEKYAKEIIELAINGNMLAVEKKTGQLVDCEGAACGCCLFFDDEEHDCPYKRLEWAESEAPDIPLDTPIDTPIWVRNEGDDTWYRRLFAGFDTEGRILAFNNRESAWTATCTTAWDHTRLATPEEIEEAKKKWRGTE